MGAGRGATLAPAGYSRAPQAFRLRGAFFLRVTDHINGLIRLHKAPEKNITTILDTRLDTAYAVDVAGMDPGSKRGTTMTTYKPTTNEHIDRLNDKYLLDPHGRLYWPYAESTPVCGRCGDPLHDGQHHKPRIVAVFGPDGATTSVDGCIIHGQ